MLFQNRVANILNLNTYINEMIEFINKTYWSYWNISFWIFIICLYFLFISRGTLYKGTLDCLFKTVRQEGFFALYKGFLPIWARMVSWPTIFIPEFNPTQVTCLFIISYSALTIYILLLITCIKQFAFYLYDILGIVGYILFSSVFKHPSVCLFNCTCTLLN